MPNPVLKDLQIIYSPDSVLIPKSACLATGGATEEGILLPGGLIWAEPGAFNRVGFN